MQNSVGVDVAALGRHDEALAIFERALATIERNPVARARHSGALHLNIGRQHRALGRPLAARTSIERGVEMFVALRGPDSLDAADGRGALGLVLADLERYPESLSELRQALAIQEKILGPDHPVLAETWWAIARTHLLASERAEAIAPLEQAIGVLSRAGYPDDPVIQFNLAEALIALGQDRERARSLATLARAGFVASGDLESVAKTDALLAGKGARR